jgi:hypothetical protein
MADEDQRELAFGSAELDAAIRSRGDDLNQIAARDLQRYYALLSRATPRFKEEEACLLAEALSGHSIPTEDIRRVWSVVQKGIQRDMLDRRWFVDGVSLIAKLRFMEPWQLMALIDAIERYSRLPVDEMGMEEALRAVGLVKEGARGFQMKTEE